MVDECGECNGGGASYECWNGDVVCDASDCEDQPGGSVEVNYDSDADIAGFQFNVEGVTILSAGGGAAEEAGFMISASETTVIGFSLSGATIPAGAGVLVVLEVEGDTGAACLADLVISDANGAALDAEVDGCTTIVVGGDDCSEGYDECGVCGGDNSSCADCAGVPNGDAVEDECGVCDGPGADVGFDCEGNCVDADVCSSATVTLTATATGATLGYSSNFDIGGFQFNVAGPALTGASSGLSNTEYSSDTGVVLGFDFTGSTLPCLLYTSPSPRDLSTSRMPSSA